LKITKYIIAVSLLTITSTAVAQNNQDPWLKKNWNNMVARFNIYFNATQKMDIALDGLAKKQKDDFNAIIDIYPYGTAADAKGMREPMEGTMKKASKVIQNKPRSKWADDAYFLIGQTQFFSGDYYAAIETFQFVNNSYTDTDIKAMSQLWLMKSYIQQGKLDDAEAILGLLGENKSTNRDFLTQLNLSGGDLLIKQGKSKEATTLLRTALPKLKDRTLKYRTHFVLGQVYLKQMEYEKANAQFIKVLKMNAPYEYVFQANLGMAKSSAQNGGQGIQKTKKYLKRMLDDDKNIEYFDQIYYEIAKLEFSTGNDNLGLDYMRKSAQNASNNNTQRTKTYLFLADYFFANRNYSDAQAYYDSTVAVIPVDFENAAKIKVKHSILSKLIESIETIAIQDSLLTLSNLDMDVLDKRINKRIEDEEERKRELAEAAKIKQEQDRLNAKNSSGGGGLNTNPIGGVWYFYNTSAVGRGVNDFQRTWGNRPYGDFWRFGNKNSMEKELTSKQDDTKEQDISDPDIYNGNEDEEQAEALKDVDASKRKYYAAIPFSATAKLMAKRKIQAAYLAIGKIYFDDLREYIRSDKELSTLLSRYPGTMHKPEALFYLSKANAEMGDSTKAANYAKQIADEYPETLFNSVLNNKEVQEDVGDKEVVVLYQKMYEAYNRDSFDDLTNIKKEIDRTYAGNSIQAKIDYLYALALGKKGGKAEYIKELEIVKEAYPGTDVGEMAAYTLRILSAEDEAVTSSNLYKYSKESTFFYVITGETTKETNVEIQLNNYNQKFFGSTPLQVKSLVFSNKQLFYIKQFKNQNTAKKYHNDITSSSDFLESAGLKNSTLYYISEANFRSLVKSKEEEEYLSFFKNKYN
jgi:TolA-binding protein